MFYCLNIKSQNFLFIFNNQYLFSFSCLNDVYFIQYINKSYYNVEYYCIYYIFMF